MSEPIDEVPVDLPIEKRLAAAVERYGEATVVLRAVSLLAGNNEGEEFLLYVGGEHARGILGGAPPLYWPELWGTRALLYVWDDSARPAVAAALGNQAWRVREMGARVAAARGLPLVREVGMLVADEVARVRASAALALGALGSLDEIEVIRPLLKDAEIDVRRAAQQGIDAIRKRLAT
ncbi:MAG: HEAT repeat domain-containing protein [Salinibacterium sp.]|nr:MAG: HEAT repeat domain-containing protein [Salinibacterium sp.]